MPHSVGGAEIVTLIGAFNLIMPMHDRVGMVRFNQALRYEVTQR